MRCEYWENLKKQLTGYLPAGAIRMWIEPVKVIDYTPDSITIGFANQYSLKWVKNHYGKLLKELLDTISGRSHTLIWQVYKAEESKDKIKESEPRTVQPELPYKPGLTLTKSGMNANFTFENFITGPANQFAHRAAIELASGSGLVTNSLFLSSETGLGKSHLSQAIGMTLLGRSPHNRVHYLSAEDFTNQMVSSIKCGKAAEFKNRYRRMCDTLILEDVHFLTGKEKTQSELAITLDSLISDGKKIVFTSSCPPVRIPGLRSDLASRMSNGLVANIDSPDFDNRIRILKAKAVGLNIDLSTRVAEIIANAIKKDVRRLESALKGIAAQSRLLNRQINTDLAREVLGGSGLLT